MNLYFWAFALYALLIMPVSAQVDAEYAQGFRWRIRLQTAGIRLVQKQKEKKSGTGDQKKRLTALVRDGTAAHILKGVRFQKLHLEAQLCFEDAAATALTFALIRTVLETARCICPNSTKTSANVRAGFGPGSTRIRVSGIFSARLGSIAFAGARLALGTARRRAREEQYAAASH